MCKPNRCSEGLKAPSSADRTNMGAFTQPPVSPLSSSLPEDATEDKSEAAGKYVVPTLMPRITLRTTTLTSTGFENRDLPKILYVNENALAPESGHQPQTPTRFETPSSPPVGFEGAGLVSPGSSPLFSDPSSDHVQDVFSDDSRMFSPSSFTSLTPVVSPASPLSTGRRDVDASISNDLLGFSGPADNIINDHSDDEFHLQVR